MKTYSVLEASETLSISTRAVQKRCKKHDVRKKDNKYLITQNDIDQWRKEIESNEPTNEPTDQVRSNELKKENESLKKELADLQKEFDKFKKGIFARQEIAKTQNQQNKL